MISAQMLARYPYFLGGGESALNLLALDARLLEFAAQEVILQEGDESRELLVLVKGMVELKLTLGTGESVTVDDLVAGDLLGLSAVSAKRIVSSTAVAKTPCQIIAIDAAKLLAVCDANPAVGYSLMKAVAAATSIRLHDARVQLAALNAH